MFKKFVGKFWKWDGQRLQPLMNLANITNPVSVNFTLGHSKLTLHCKVKILASLQRS